MCCRRATCCWPDCCRKPCLAQILQAATVIPEVPGIQVALATVNTLLCTSLLPQYPDKTMPAKPVDSTSTLLACSPTIVSCERRVCMLWTWLSSPYLVPAARTRLYLLGRAAPGFCSQPQPDYRRVLASRPAQIRPRLPQSACNHRADNLRVLCRTT